MKKKSGGRVRLGGGGQGGCDRRIEVIVKMKKKVGGNPARVVRVDMNQELVIVKLQ